MSDIRTAFKDFAGDLAVKTRKVKRKVRPLVLLDFANNPDAAIAAFAAMGGTITRAGDTATLVNEQGLIEIVPANTWRIDYDPVTLRRLGPRIEEARENVLQQSGSIGTAPWSIPGTTTDTLNAAAAPDGTNSATLLKETAVTDQFFNSQAGGVNGTTYTFSIFVKAAARSWCRLEGAAGGNGAWFDLTNGVIGTVQPGTTATIKSYGNGWYRCSIARQMDATQAFYVFAQTADNQSGYAGTAGQGAIYVWGAQVEQAAFPTSYIPTTAAAVTRNADVAKVSDISGFVNETESTVVAEFICGTLSGDRYVGQFDDGTNAERTFIAQNVDLNAWSVVGGVGVQMTMPAATIGAVTRCAVALKANDSALSKDGAAVYAEGAIPLPAGLTTLRLGSNGVLPGYELNGHLPLFAYFGARLPNQIVQAMAPVGAPLEVELDEEITLIDGLEEEDGLETAVVNSLFTDRRAEAGDVLPGADRRGWWGDSFAEIEGDRIGSRLWLLSREKQLPSVLARAREYAAEALQWMVDDGIARAVNVNAEIVSQGVLGLQIEIVRSDMPVAQYRFETFWKGA